MDELTMAVMPKWQKRRRGDGRADGGGADSSSANYQQCDEPRARGGDPEGEEAAELHATIDCERMSIAVLADDSSLTQWGASKARVPPMWREELIA